jgi:hypothetical protein
MCHREITAYVLPKLKAIDLTNQVDHPHTAQPLQALFVALEQAEEQERARLPTWRPPALETLGRHQQECGEWDRDEASPPASACGADIGSDALPSGTAVSWNPKG